MSSTDTNAAVNADQLVRQLNWRYATKKFDPAKKISAENWSAIEQSLVLCPSSFGMQPWKFIVVTDSAVREKIKGAAWNQGQVTDASHLVVIAHQTNVSENDARKLIDTTASVRGIPPASLEGYYQMIVGSIAKGGIAHVGAETWASMQSYIALGFILSAAAMLGIDACPMEGFEPAKVDEILGLSKMGYHPTVLVPVGYRALDDKYGPAPKVRYSAKELIVRV